MKLIVVGATGYVGQELIRQSLARTDVSSVVAVARKPVSPPDNLPDGSDVSKLKPVVLKDYDDYPEDAKKEFAGANACIWTVGLTPSKAKKVDDAEQTRICQTSTVNGLRAMHEAGPASPFRFLYMSGLTCERDQTKTSWRDKQYKVDMTDQKFLLMRGETENRVLAFAAQHEGIEACVAKPALIYSPGLIMNAAAKFVNVVAGMPSITVQDVSKAMLDQVVRGFEREPLLASDLIRLAKKT